MPQRNRSPLLAALLIPFAFGCDSATDTGGSAANCTQTTALTVGTALNGNLAASDCKAEGAYEDNFRFSISAPTMVKVTLSADNSSEFIIADDTTASSTIVDEQFTGTRTFYVALPAGPHMAQIGSPKTGNYAINMTASAAPSGCITDASPVYVTRGSVVTGAITNTDCVNNGYYGDPYRIAMVTNSVYSFGSTGSMGVNLELNHVGTVLAHNNNNNPGSVTLNYRATLTDNHNIAVIAIPQNTFGSYTFTVN